MAGGEAETTSRLHAAGSFPSVILPSTRSRVQIGKCVDGGYERTFRPRTADGRSIRNDSRQPEANWLKVFIQRQHCVVAGFTWHKQHVRERAGLEFSEYGYRRPVSGYGKP